LRRNTDRWSEELRRQVREFREEVDELKAVR
jgi:hypothetical protein